MEGPTQCLNVTGHHQRFPRQQCTLSATIYVQRVWDQWVFHDWR